MKPSVSIVLPISRISYLRPVFNCLAELNKPPLTELLIIIDGSPELHEAVGRRLGTIQFDRIQVINFGDSPAESLNDRRYRISEIHNLAKLYASGDYIFSIEDDTVYPPETLTKLLDYFNDINCAFVEAVQLGRRNTPYIGAWKVNDLNNPTEIKSLLPKKGSEEIDAGGLYCALIDGGYYRKHHFEPFDKQGTNGLSCDLNLGLWLRKQGKKCLIDWSIQTDHIGDKGSVNLGNTKPRQVVFTKDQDWFGMTV